MRWPDVADGPAVRDDDGGGVVPHAVYCRRMEGLREARVALLADLV